MNLNSYEILYTATRMAKIKKTDHTNVDEDIEQLGLSHIAN